MPQVSGEMQDELENALWSKRGTCVERGCAGHERKFGLHGDTRPNIPQKTMAVRTKILIANASVSGFTSPSSPPPPL
jgi:hypothetical protein